jgi:hypothetical protein
MNALDKLRKRASKREVKLKKQREERELQRIREEVFRAIEVI